MIRERREELQTTIPFVANGTNVLTNGVPRDLPLTRLLLCCEGRMVQAAQTVAGVIMPEAPQSIIRNITLRGTKVTGGGSIVLSSGRGEEFHAMTRFYERYTPVGSAVADTPGVGGTAFPAPLAATANGSFDFRCYYVVPVAPRWATHKDEIAGILDPSIFSLLELSITFGDATFLVSPATAPTPTLSAFGSGAGVPQVFVTRFSPLAEGLPIGKFHYTWLSKQINMGALAATANDTKITDFNVGNKLRFAMLRQYAEAAGKPGLIDQAAGVSLARIGDGSNIGAFRWRVKLNGSEKLRVRNQDLREHNRQMYAQNALMPLGYSILEWGDRGFLEDIFDTRGFGATATRFELNGDWQNVVAADRLDILQCEQIPILT